MLTTYAKGSFLSDYIQRKNKDLVSPFLSYEAKKRTMFHQLIALKFLCRTVRQGLETEGLQLRDYNRLRIDLGNIAVEIIDLMEANNARMSAAEYRELFVIPKVTWQQHYNEELPVNPLQPLFEHLLSAEPIADFISIALFTEEMLLQPKLRKKVTKLLRQSIVKLIKK